MAHAMYEFASRCTDFTEFATTFVFFDILGVPNPVNKKQLLRNTNIPT